MEKKSIKIALVGAGSLSFTPCTVKDILLSEKLAEFNIEFSLMDIDKHALETCLPLTLALRDKVKRSDVKITATLDLDEALKGTSFVITAIEVDRMLYWSMDFHLPRRYGFRSVYGENAGPGGMFHLLRNLPPMLQIVRRMEAICSDAFLINYSNPEAKLIDALSKLSNIRMAGLCHGYMMGCDQIAKILGREEDSMEIVGHGLNHFGFMTSIRDKKTGKDLYPELKKREKECNWLSMWDDIALSRIMFRTYGLWPYPGTNHIGEYFAWSDSFLAGSKINYFYDPVSEHPWEEREAPNFVYSFSDTLTSVDYDEKAMSHDDQYQKSFEYNMSNLEKSREYGIPIIESVLFDLHTVIPSLNVPNHGQMPELLDGMAVEGPVMVDASGFHPLPGEAKLPVGVAEMMNIHGGINQLLLEAFTEKSRNKLLQALLLDPTISNYNNAIALIDEMYELQKDILPEMNW
jgi:alpha-galactosidase